MKNLVLFLLLLAACAPVASPNATASPTAAIPTLSSTLVAGPSATPSPTALPTRTTTPVPEPSATTNPKITPTLTSTPVAPLVAHKWSQIGPLITFEKDYRGWPVGFRGGLSRRLHAATKRGPISAQTNR